VINANDLASITIRRVIFHDVPRNPRGGNAEPTLAEDETRLDAARKQLLKKKLVQVLGSSKAYPIEFDSNSASPVPAEVRAFTLKNSSRSEFVVMSQKLAFSLFEQQHGGISPGLLCAMDVASAGFAGVVLMKLEREEGAQLELVEHAGKKVFDMSVLDNLVLTQGTRLFKTALFLRTGKEEDSFRSSACDSQLNVTSSDEMARFWLRFLGCQFSVEPRVATQRFYDSALSFINKFVTDPIHKDELYEHLQSQMKASQRTFSPRSFVENYVPEDYQSAFSDHLKSENLWSGFTKDVADITTRLRTSAYLTAHGVRVSVPAENAQIVDVGPERIIVNDSLVSVDRR